MGNLKKTILVSLLLTASAITSTFAQPVTTNTLAAQSAAQHRILTPTAPVAPSVRRFDSSSRDIPQSGSILHLWVCVLVAAGVIAICGICFWLRHSLLHGEFLKMKPHEIALQYLGEACQLRDPDYTHEYCYKVARILRQYIEQHFGIQNVRLPTEEFLRELTTSPTALSASHRRLLAVFLKHYQSAKTAGWYFCRLDLELMHLSAVEFVSQTALDNPRPAPRHVTSSSAKTVVPPRQRGDGSKH